MRRGTTPTHVFTLPEGLDENIIFSARIVYAQGGAVKLVLAGDRLSISGRTVTVKLTQQESLAFEDSTPVEIQVRILTIGGDALTSNIREISVQRCLDDEVLA